MTNSIQMVAMYRPKEAPRVMGIPKVSKEALEVGKALVDAIKKISATPVKQPMRVPVKKAGKKLKVFSKLIQDANAVEINFPDLQDSDPITVGAAAEIDNKPATGDYLLPNGITYVFRLGKLSKILPAAKEAFASLKAEIAQLNKMVSTAECTPDRTAGIRGYLDSKKSKVNPTATPENRFAGILDRVKDLKRTKK